MSADKQRHTQLVGGIYLTSSFARINCAILQLAVKNPPSGPALPPADRGHREMQAPGEIKEPFNEHSRKTRAQLRKRVSLPRSESRGCIAFALCRTVARSLTNSFPRANNLAV